VTAKGRSRTAKTIQWPLFRSFLPYLFLTVAGILWSFVLDDTRPLADASGMALVWSWYNIVLLVLACFVAIEASDRRRDERFEVNRFGVLSTPGGAGRFLISDISISGMRLTGKPPVKPVFPSACNTRISTSRRWSCALTKAGSPSASWKILKCARS